MKKFTKGGKFPMNRMSEGKSPFTINEVKRIRVRPILCFFPFPSLVIATAQTGPNRDPSVPLGGDASEGPSIVRRIPCRPISLGSLPVEPLSPFVQTKKAK